jgi:hypothetical protein
MSGKWHYPSYPVSAPMVPSSYRVASRALAGICWLSGSAVHRSWRNRQYLGYSARSGQHCSRGSRRPMFRVTALGCGKHTRCRVAICWPPLVIRWSILGLTYPTPPSPTSAVRESGRVHFWMIWSMMGPLIDGGLAVDKVWVSTERDDDRRTRWGFSSFWLY